MIGRFSAKSTAGSHAERTVLDARTPPPDYAASLAIPRYTTSLSPLLSVRPDILFLILSHLTYHDLFYTVRPSCRHLALAALSLLRKAYIPHYLTQIKPPYTTDVLTLLPSAEITASTSSQKAPPPVPPPERKELHVLSLYISSCLYSSRLSSESPLFLLPTEEAKRDLFEVHQPRARLEDLIVELGYRRHLITHVPDWDDLRIRSKDVSVKWGMKVVALQLPCRSQSGRGTISKDMLKVERSTRLESLEETARKLLDALEGMRIRRFENEGVFWYEKE
ncbi:hypothetical protein BT69DRAFT_21608 [Atractiella rhizophila]|nr:hypothetical protein BT69DRAFT_21608 [Atractiella rhizophila]